MSKDNGIDVCWSDPAADTKAPGGVDAQKALNSLAPATAAKYAKPDVYSGVLYRFPRSMLEIAKVSAFGTKKHNVHAADRSYMDIPNAFDVYSAAVSRHLINEAIEGPVNLDPNDGGMLHAAQLAWDALARLEIFLRNREQNLPAPLTKN